MKTPAMSEDAAELVRHQRQVVRAVRRSRRAQPGKAEKAPASEAERSERFRRRSRRLELEAVEAERRTRVANVDRWAAEERRKIREKYQVVGRQLKRMGL